MKKIIGIIALSFILGNGSASNLNLPSLEEFSPTFHKRNWIHEQMGIQMIQRFTPVKKRHEPHNRGILELKPKWFPKQSISKKGERTYYYWEF
jgi:hypothetical protein